MRMQGTCLLAMDGHFLIAQCDMCPDSDVALLLRLTPKPEDTAGNYQKPSTCQTWEDGREYHSQTRPGDVMREDRTHTVRTLPAAHREGQAKLCCPSFQLLSFKVKASTSPLRTCLTICQLAVASHEASAKTRLFWPMWNHEPTVGGSCR